MIIVAYPERQRFKPLGHMRSVSRGNDSTKGVLNPIAKLRPERVRVFLLDASEWNCPKYITPRYTEEKVEAAIVTLRECP
jgi:hypothetical protein